MDPLIGKPNPQLEQVTLPQKVILALVAISSAVLGVLLFYLMLE